MELPQELPTRNSHDLVLGFSRFSKQSDKPIFGSQRDQSELQNANNSETGATG